MKDTTMGNQQAKTWFTGFFDGEGSLQIIQQKTKKKVYYNSRIDISGTCFRTRDYVKNLYLAMGIRFHEEFRKGTDKVKDSWSIRTQGLKRCSYWLTVFPPSLFVTKQDEALTLEEFITSRLNTEGHQKPYTAREQECRNLLTGRRMPHRLHAERGL